MKTTKLRGLGLGMPGRAHPSHFDCACLCIAAPSDSRSPIPWFAEEQFVDALIARKEKALKAGKAAAAPFYK